MDDNLEAALKVYGHYLDGSSTRMDETIIRAIRTLREYVYLRNPLDQDIQHKILTARRSKMSGAELRSLVSPDR